MREGSPEVGARRSEQGAGRLGRRIAGAGAAADEGAGTLLCLPAPGRCSWARTSRTGRTPEPDKGEPLWERLGTPTPPGAASGSWAESQSWNCLDSCEGAGFGSREGAGRGKLVAFLFTVPVLVCPKPVLFTLRNLMGVHRASC